MDEKQVVYCEKLTPEEEADFLRAVNDAEESGEITAQDAIEMIDREYELWSQSK